MTGAYGFLGQETCEILEKLHGQENVVRVGTTECDLTDAVAVDSLAARIGRVAAVFFAGKSPYHGSDPETFRLNVVQIDNFLSAFANQLTSFIYVSTTFVYGPAPQLPITEQTLLAPASPYAVSKLVGEFMAYQRSEQFPVTIFRVASTYGRHDDGKRAVTGRLLRNILNDSAVVITGDGSQVRELTHAADIANIIAECVTRPRPGIFNLTSGLRYTLNEIVSVLERASGRQVQREYQPSDHVVSQYFDNAKLKKNFSDYSFGRLEDVVDQMVWTMRESV